MTPAAAAELLVAAWRGGSDVDATAIQPVDRDAAYAIQHATLAQTGPIAGWKVGAKSIGAEPTFAPLPSTCLLPSGSTLKGSAWRLRGIEVEAALRLARDLRPQGRLLSRAELADAFDAALPVIEVVETRLAGWQQADPLSKLADLQSHGALVMGAASALSPVALDLRTLKARLSFDGRPVAQTLGGNPAVDVWRLLACLALHCEQRGEPLRAGQIVTTGSCTGMLFAPAGAVVTAQLDGIGPVGLRF